LSQLGVQHVAQPITEEVEEAPVALCEEHKLAKRLKSRVGRRWLQTGEALIELEYEIRASQEPACNLPITGKREYIGNKIIFQTKVFDGDIMVIYVTLFIVLVQR